ncbi:hypothetical protein E9549_05290 [Blastococcus sp. MG754426]|uniref:hypothetical protein n=1 Tax=unclassified Blastococcus TaxID=2619396 RepID=UPI0027148320|nr:MULTISPECIES: hypothetical protein [unclassified Blastococcus]MCF6506822.1 hypothetical protein [Blastococcus sp. MG754426]MCF6511622.1 hypothetical protein [Blastococcus sp. MG754427]
MTGWEYSVEPSDVGWVWLPRSGAVAGWAREVCADLGAHGQGAARLGAQLRSLGAALRQGPPDLAALWVPDPVHGVLASLRADRYRLTTGLAELAEQERAAAGRGLAPPAVDLVPLPAGPALRVRRVARQVAGQGEGLLVESVSHLVAPPGAVEADGVPTGVELVMAWTLLHEGEQFADMADRTAEGLRGSG